MLGVVTELCRLFILVGVSVDGNDDFGDDVLIGLLTSSSKHFSYSLF
ncbi:MAG: hypothetical protein ACI8RD_010913 [Bacillariaceae sp.]|jgi:hypothetical protein